MTGELCYLELRQCNGWPCLHRVPLSPALVAMLLAAARRGLR